jgi:hypothetical protein
MNSCPIHGLTAKSKSHGTNKQNSEPRKEPKSRELLAATQALNNSQSNSNLRLKSSSRETKISKQMIRLAY